MQLPSLTEQLDDACRRVALGKKTARQLDELVSAHGLKETEFRLLWALRSPSAPWDQIHLAEQLGCSPARVSAVVERLSRAGQIVGQAASADRRRNLWRLSAQGRDLLEAIIAGEAEEKQPPTLRVHPPGRNSA